jgi:hypothetical protein
MRHILLALGALAAIAIVLLWPHAAIHVSRDPYGSTVRGSMSGERAVILLLAVVTFIAAAVSGVVSAVRHRA